MAAFASLPFLFPPAGEQQRARHPGRPPGAQAGCLPNCDFISWPRAAAGGRCHGGPASTAAEGSHFHFQRRKWNRTRRSRFVAAQRTHSGDAMSSEGDSGAGPSSSKDGVQEKGAGKEEEVQSSLNRLLISGNGAWLHVPPLSQTYRRTLIIATGDGIKSMDGGCMMPRTPLRSFLRDCTCILSSYAWPMQTKVVNPEISFPFFSQTHYTAERLRRSRCKACGEATRCAQQEARVLGDTAGRTVP